MRSLATSIITPLEDSTYNIFVIVKPGFEKIIPEVVNVFNRHGWYVYKTRPKQLLLSEAKKLYDIHKKEDWYKELCEYMASGLSTAFIFKKNKPMSPKMFDETNKIKDEIRNKWGESEMRNVIHSSDSMDRMMYERGIYF